MGDSDDEFGRRRGRDKFMKERNDFQQDKRRDFSQNDRRGYMQNRNDYRMRDNRQASPPTKRLRREWDDNYDPSIRRDGQENAPQSGGGSSGGSNMMSFKQFLTTQDDSISDEEAIQKYQDYKLEHKRQQLHSFFVQHKDEEWFRLKYHPEDSAKLKAEQSIAIQRRLSVFLDLQEKKWLDKCNLDHDNCQNIIKFMDAVVIKLEGGTDEDIAALEKLEELLDDSYEEPPKRTVTERDATKEKTSRIRQESENSEKPMKKGGEDGALSDSDVSEKGSVGSDKSKSPLPPSAGENVKETEDLSEKDEPKQSEEQAIEQTTKNEDKFNGNHKSRKRKLESTDEQDVDELSPDEEDGISSPVPKEKSSSPKRKTSSAKDEFVDSVNPTRMVLHKTSSIFLRNLAPSITKSEVEALCKRFPGFLRVSLAEPIPDRKFYRRGWVTFKRDVNIKEICWNLNSVRLKDCDMLPIVNRDLLRRVRFANGVLSHKQVAQNDLRLAARLVQIYDKKYNLWQDEVNGDGQLQKNSARHDHCPSEFNFTSKNPLLRNITDFLIEEASAEEEELLGTFANSGDESDQKVVFERDDQILKVLDRIILYLRVVHSIDFYNHGEYFCEDEMPHRCGLIHARGPPIPPSQYGMDDKGRTLLSTSFITDFCKIFENHLQQLLSPKDRLSDDEADKLGRKDVEKEVEAFINANCQELAKDKWLCPLSGKKFKGPEFVRKHILNKHNEKLDEVRTEVLYFNNFVCDPKRPTPVETKPSVMQSQQSYSQQSSSYGGQNYGSGGGGYDRNSSRDDQPPQQRQDYYNRSSGGGGSYGGGGGGYYRNQNDYGGGGGYRRDHYQRRDFGNQGGYGGNRGAGSRHYQATPSDTRRDPRVPVTYTDLDAPEDVY
uniref:Serrate RNA effector molecule homolog n=1 Tax=Romanomermis culicivorax TaxID=13658 RepID=A0A915ISC8_ROMCU